MENSKPITQEELNAFLVDYRELVKKHGLDITSQVILTRSAAAPDKTYDESNPKSKKPD
ncbi:MAG: hypothetical protein KGI72_05285 [Patescibacteria group bacterium]|nr:hypothetical protein [Patescibacteria group bacterium]MDE2233073.1 hypothetical protein [Patescibacteria group bacterium]